MGTVNPETQDAEATSMTQPDLFERLTQAGFDVVHLTPEQANAAARKGMARALEHAEAESPKWGDVAFAFLTQFARTHKKFISEEVSDASKAWGMVQPPSDRAWGAIYRRAIKLAIIVQDGSGRSLRRHGSICPRWMSLVCP